MGTMSYNMLLSTAPWKTEIVSSIKLRFVVVVTLRNISLCSTLRKCDLALFLTYRRFLSSEGISFHINIELKSE